MTCSRTIRLRRSLAAVLVAIVLAPAAARLASAQTVVDDEIHTVSQCGAGILQMSCVAVALRFQSICSGQCSSASHYVILLKESRLVGATDTPLGGTADFRVERCVYTGPSFEDLTCTPFTFSPPIAGGCTWPLLGLPQSCEVVDTDATEAFPNPVGPQIRVTAAASSLLSGVSLQEDVDIAVSAKGELFFP
jgi:hypothetical protein